MPPGRPGDPRPWPWWSVTKTAIAACALRLSERGLVNLDAPVPVGGTLAHLLAHTGGLGCYGALPDYHAAVARGDRPWTGDEMVARVGPPEAAPGTGWRYSNIGYLLARRHLETATGLALDDLLRREVLHPLGLDGTRMARGVEALPHLPGAERYDFDWVAHGCLLGPPADAAAFLDGVLGGRLFGPAALARMTYASVLDVDLSGRVWTGAGYGLGLMAGPAGDVHLAGHSGDGPFSACAVYRGPRGDVAAAFTQGPGEAAAERAVLRALA